MNPIPLTAWRMILAVCFATSLSTLTGCYNGDAMIEQARSTAMDTRLAEIDLGSYATSLPRDRDTNSVVELRFRIFGTVRRYKVPDVESQLAADGFRIRHAALAAVRQATPEELTEPDFTQLRARIETVVNSILSDAPVKTIGFYEMRLVNR